MNVTDKDGKLNCRKFKFAADTARDYLYEAKRAIDNCDSGTAQNALDQAARVIAEMSASHLAWMSGKDR